MNRRTKSTGEETSKHSFNPLLAFLYFRMSLMAWKNYVKEREEKMIQCKEDGIEYIPSPEESSTDPDAEQDYDSEFEERSDEGGSEGDDDDGIEELPEGESSSNSEEQGSESQVLDRSINYNKSGSVINGLSRKASQIADDSISKSHIREIQEYAKGIASLKLIERESIGKIRSMNKSPKVSEGQDEKSPI